MKAPMKYDMLNIVDASKMKIIVLVEINNERSRVVAIIELLRVKAIGLV